MYIFCAVGKLGTFEKVLYFVCFADSCYISSFIDLSELNSFISWQKKRCRLYL